MGRVGSGEIAVVARLSTIVLGGLFLANCSATDKLGRRIDPKYGVSASPRVVEFGQPVPKGGGTYRTGKPYVVAGRTYVPNEGKGYRSEGWASWYGSDFHGRLTANGEVFDMESVSAAHPTLPMPSYARVTNLSNRKSIMVRVNDRGPFHANREIDLSNKAARLLGFHARGLTRVRVEYVGSAPLEGSDDRVLAATLRENGPAPLPSRVMVAAAEPPAARAAVRTGQAERLISQGSAPDEPPASRVASADLPQVSEMSGARAAALGWNKGPDPVAFGGGDSVRAYAPMRRDPIGGLISGRGLY